MQTDVAGTWPESKLRESPAELPPKLLMDRIEILREGRCSPG